MSELFGQAALTISSMLFASLWEGALVVLAVWLFLRAFSGLGASTRYAIWFAVLLMLAIAPLCTSALSSQHGNTVAAAQVTAVNAQTQPALEAQSNRTSPVISAPAVPQRHRIDISLELSIAIAAMWLAAAGVRLTVLAISLRRLSSLRRCASALPAAFGCDVLASERTDVPLAIGFVRPAVVLPASLSADLSSGALEAIVMHEIAHLRRYDVWTNALARVFEALLALNPLAWFVLRQLSIEREIACDDWVVAHLDAGEVFAGALASMLCRLPFRSVAAPTAIGSKHALVARIEQLLDRRPRRLRLSAPALTGVVVVLALFATLVPGFSPVLALASTGAAQNGGCNHPPLFARMDFKTGRPTNHWESITRFMGKANDPRNTVVDLTIDAHGRLVKSAVVSSPHTREARAARRILAMERYRPAESNCKAIASTTRIAFFIDIAPPAAISVVRAVYPDGWTTVHPGSCKVPDLTHGGVPQVRLVNDRTVSASVLVRVDAAGRVVSAKLTRSSGNAAYDDATLAAARGRTYPIGDGFKPVRPSGATLAWNAAHGYAQYSACSPLPSTYTWTTTFPPSGR